MTLVYIMVCCLPVVLIVLVVSAIVAAGQKTFKTGNRLYRETKPHIDNLVAQGHRAQQMSASFAERGNKLAESFEEMSGRWAFIVEEVQGTRESPLVKMAGMAGRFLGSED